MFIIINFNYTYKFVYFYIRIFFNLCLKRKRVFFVFFTFDNIRLQKNEQRRRKITYNSKAWIPIYSFNTTFFKKKKKPKTWSWILVEQSQMIYKKQLKQKTEMATNQCKKAPISDDKKLPKKIKSTSSSQIKWGTTQKRINRMQEKYRIKREINWYTSIDDGGFQGLRLVFWKRNWWM